VATAFQKPSRQPAATNLSSQTAASREPGHFSRIPAFSSHFEPDKSRLVAALSAVSAQGDSSGFFRCGVLGGVEVDRERPEDYPGASVRAVRCSIFRKVVTVAGVGE
jgi:hypothetical protein